MGFLGFRNLFLIPGTIFFFFFRFSRTIVARIRRHRVDRFFFFSFNLRTQKRHIAREICCRFYTGKKKRENKSSDTSVRHRAPLRTDVVIIFIHLTKVMRRDAAPVNAFLRDFTRLETWKPAFRFMRVVSRICLHINRLFFFFFFLKYLS